MNNLTYLIKSAVLGHAVGDALGVPVEFLLRKEMDRKPIKTMEGFGTYPYPAGTWSDDTSMALCTLDSLIKGKIDYEDIMKNFVRWINDNEYTPAGEAFDIGRTCLKAIVLYCQGNPLDICGRGAENSNGNGSLMRIHPMTLYLRTRDDLTLDEKIDAVHKTSAITHAHDRSKIGCGIYSFILWELMDNPSKESIFAGLDKAKAYYAHSEEIDKYRRIFEKAFVMTERDDISSSGYVVDTLEAALWCLLTTDSYRDCVLKAVNLGEDTDTVAAIAGGLAGVLYGYDAIPEEWLDTLIRREYIEKLCCDAADKW